TQAPAQRGGVPADAAGKGDDIDAGHGRGIGSDIFAYAVGVDLNGDLRVLIALRRPFLDVAHVVAQAGERRQAAVVVKGALDVGGGEGGRPGGVREPARIAVAGQRGA